MIFFCEPYCYDNASIVTLPGLPSAIIKKSFIIIILQYVLSTYSSQHHLSIQ